MDNLDVENFHNVFVKTCVGLSFKIIWIFSFEHHGKPPKKILNILQGEKQLSLLVVNYHNSNDENMQALIQKWDVIH